MESTHANIYFLIWTNFFQKNRKCPALPCRRPYPPPRPPSPAAAAGGDGAQPDVDGDDGEDVDDVKDEPDVDVHVVRGAGELGVDGALGKLNWRIFFLAKNWRIFLG